jgi:hypothetical protein
MYRMARVYARTVTQPYGQRNCGCSAAAASHDVHDTRDAAGAASHTTISGERSHDIGDRTRTAAAAHRAAAAASHDMSEHA